VEDEDEVDLSSGEDKEGGTGATREMGGSTSMDVGGEEKGV